MPSAAPPAPSRAGSRSSVVNVLLLKSPVGAARPSTYKLPSQENPSHVYGIRVEKPVDENAATVLRHWEVNKQSKAHVHGFDYVSMNRASAKAGLTTAKDVRDFQKEHPIRLKARSSSSGGAGSACGGGAESESFYHNSPLAAQPGVQKKSRTPLPSDVHPNHTYGKPVRPSTPVAQLMIDRTTTDAREGERKKQEQREREKREKAKQKKITAAGLVAARKPAVQKSEIDPKNLWRISRFTKADHKVDDVWVEPPRTTGPDIKIPFEVPVHMPTKNAVGAH
ncbi:hypothetical protein M427DRAFT_28385 [Gonapodya prolifera JEL478]|uniref:Uncharacterized protein n=1 Tax=Gonapodya prolifera (strain JEL478) TaxID=1344416 RepID=A0A139AU63_GONPJ|nr:hypothetical protein M427DRAFT_28385 [Gonapodya prolifera JEL478]|eukprot:KXS20035.1 hypothetical protein M427DRAFT_28385 [Gonapodya prolifera JEL478]